MRAVQPPEQPFLPSEKMAMCRGRYASAHAPLVVWRIQSQPPDTLSSAAVSAFAQPGAAGVREFCLPCPFRLSHAPSAAALCRYSRAARYRSPAMRVPPPPVVGARGVVLAPGRALFRTYVLWCPRCARCRAESSQHVLPSRPVCPCISYAAFVIRYVDRGVPPPYQGGIGLML